MPKMRVRCASLSGRRPPRRAYALATRVLATFALALGLLAASARPARAAARRIVLMHADADLTRSVDLALYPWDIAVVEVDEPLPDATAPDAVASARSIAKRHSADAIAWIERTDESATLWFFDASDSSLHSHPLPLSPQQDAAQLAAVALTLKTLVRATPWESRIPTVVHEHKGTGWESHLELDVLARVPVSGANGEPRLGLWVSEWYGTSRWMVGAALGTSAGLGMTSDDASSHSSLQDIDVRGAIRARLRLARHFILEPKLGASAHIERADVTTTTPADTQSFTRVDPSLDAGLSIGWLVTESFVWSIGVEALESLTYQRWLEGQEVVFAPSALWIQGGSSISWSFR
ncbi:MAG: hypothetical protein ACLQVI_06915 [Polyangiaceae bacterium]|jgi:hypothetical protein